MEIDNHTRGAREFLFMIWFKFNPSELLRKWPKRSLDDFGTYCTIYMLAWDNQGLPNNLQKISDLSGLPLAKIEAVWDIFKSHCVENLGLLLPVEMAQGVESYRAKIELAKRGGKASAERRFTEDKGVISTDASTPASTSTSTDASTDLDLDLELKNKSNTTEEKKEKTLMSSSQSRTVTVPSFSTSIVSVKEIFSHWQNQLKHPKAKLTGSRIKKIQLRLREGYTVEQIKTAIDGCAASPFHRGENDRNEIYDDIELICRDGVKLEKFIAIAERGTPAANQTYEEQMAVIKAAFFAKHSAANQAQGVSK